MNKLSILLAASAIVGSAAASAAIPAKLLGDPATPEYAQRTIVITPATRFVNVTEGDVVKFVANGKIFTWYFDTPPEVSSFELNRVAPEGALDHSVTAYVTHGDQWVD